MNKLKKLIPACMAFMLAWSPLAVFADAGELIYTSAGALKWDGTSDIYSSYIHRWVNFNVDQVTENSTPLHVFLYRPESSQEFQAVYWLYDAEYTEGLRARAWRSSDGLIYTNSSNLVLSNTYTYTDTATGDTYSTIRYGRSTSVDFGAGLASVFMPSDVPRITLNSSSTGSSLDTILACISGDLSGPYPWFFTGSSGGIHFDDGSSLDASQRSEYSNIFNIMDSSDDDTITESEVNNYNQTYNTNFDYSTINDGPDFDLMTFLMWVANRFMDGDDNPGDVPGGGEGGEGGAGGSSSQQQQQQQTIEENAVNVTITHGVTEDNVEFINDIINGTDEHEPSFQNAITGMKQFITYGNQFSELVSSYLGFLPQSVTIMYGTLFAVVGVVAVFRLIHLFL